MWNSWEKIKSAIPSAQNNVASLVKNNDLDTFQPFKLLL